MSSWTGSLYCVDHASDLTSTNSVPSNCWTNTGRSLLYSAFRIRILTNRRITSRAPPLETSTNICPAGKSVCFLDLPRRSCWVECLQCYSETLCIRQNTWKAFFWFSQAVFYLPLPIFAHTSSQEPGAQAGNGHCCKWLWWVSSQGQT